MNIAFSTVGAPKWDFETLASRAKEYGYDGVEIRGGLGETVLTSANVFDSDIRKVRSAFDSAGIRVACLSSSIAMSGKKRKDAQAAADLVRYVDAAHALDCSLVKIFDMQVNPGQSRAEAAGHLAKWLSPMGDYAADHGVTLVIENALSFRNSKEMWLILEMLNHPAVAVCWDLFNAALVGEPPSVSVPTLNNRIQYVHVKDATLGPLGASFCKLGEGNVRVEDFIRRLKGIGYTGWVTFEWEKAWLPNLAEPEEILPDAATKLKQWTKPADAEEAETKKSDAHPASAH